MTSYLDRYKSRVNQGNKLISNSKSSSLNNFENHPYYSLVDIDGKQTDSIVVQDDNKSEDKKLLLKPDTKLNIGAVVKIKNLFYLTMDFLGEGINEIYPTAILKLCNSTFPIQTSETTLLLSDDNGNLLKDKYGRPLPIKDGNIKQEPCIVDPNYFFRGMTDQMTMPQDNIAVTLKYQESPSLAMNKEFDMYDSRFKIMFIDYSKVINGKGIITITGERVDK